MDLQSATLALFQALQSSPAYPFQPSLASIPKEPPVPRATGKKPKHKPPPFSRQQTRTLLSILRHDDQLLPVEKEIVGIVLGLSFSQVNRWFCNARARELRRSKKYEEVEHIEREKEQALDRPAISANTAPMMSRLSFEIDPRLLLPTASISSNVLEPQSSGVDTHKSLPFATSASSPNTDNPISTYRSWPCVNGAGFDCLSSSKTPDPPTVTLSSCLPTQPTPHVSHNPVDMFEQYLGGLLLHPSTQSDEREKNDQNVAPSRCVTIPLKDWEDETDFVGTSSGSSHTGSPDVLASPTSSFSSFSEIISEVDRFFNNSHSDYHSSQLMSITADQHAFFNPLCSGPPSDLS